jgi:hypothetical protein
MAEWQKSIYSDPLLLLIFTKFNFPKESPFTAVMCLAAAAKVHGQLEVQ